ncbi:MAG: hypothetical protein OEU32_20135 [Acidimicrobiia bacterium]|nr:hypothetical protein [Acidimicrobiia bacterium]
MADDLDLSAILHSPLDEPPPPSTWWPAVVGLLVGAAAVLGGYAVAGRDDATVPTTSVVSTTVTTVSSALVPLDEVAFPPGYRMLTEVVALAPVAAIAVDEELLIGVSFVARRGLDPEGVLPASGVWVLETAAGETIQSTGSVVDPATPGVFSVVFPNPGDVALRTLRMIERWNPDPRSGSQMVGVAPLPGSVAGPVAIDLGGGVTLNVSGINIGERTADLAWDLTGTTRGGDVNLALRVQEDGVDLAVYFPTVDVFFSRDALDADDAAGTIGLQRDQGIQGDLATATHLVVDADVTLVVGTPTNLEFDVSDLPVAAR